MGDSSSVSSELQSGVVSFADPFHDDRLLGARAGSGLSSDLSVASTVTIDTAAPLFTSDSSSAFINENSGSDQVVYTAAFSDTSAITYSLKNQNTENPEEITIDPVTGEVKIAVDPDYESQIPMILS